MVVDELSTSIIKGELADGELLPPENRLCESFGVSRSILREAIKVLASKGLVEVRQGHGTRVRIPRDEIPEEALNTYLMTNPPSLLQLMEVRIPLEIEIAKLAAQRCQEMHIAMLEESLQHMQADLDDFEAVVEADDAFHQVIIEATENPIFRIIMRPLLKYLHLSRQLTVGHFGSAIVIRQHREVYEAIRDHDQVAAEQYMRAQMEVTLKHLQEIDRRQPDLLQPTL
jgi:GntR family transcriptional repressor for pyruvate dehydrogenase complex